MRVLKTPAASISAGLLVSLIVITQLVSVAMKWRAGPDPTLIGFFSQASNFIFIVYVSALLFCVWLLRGANNRMMYVFWCLGSCIHYFFYFAGIELFLYVEPVHRNIYALNWLSTVCIIPLLLFCRYRNYLVIHVLAVMIRFDIFKSSATAYFNELKHTDFENKLRRGASFWFVVEFCFSLFLTIFAMSNDLSPNESLKRAITTSGIPNPFPLYYWCIDFISAYFVLLILVNSIRDYQIPDWQSSSVLTELQRKDIIKGRKPSKFDPF